MKRRYRVKEGESPEALAKLGKGDARELYLANKTWLSSTFQPWNAGQQVDIPAAWAPIPDEFPEVEG